MDLAQGLKNLVRKKLLKMLHNSIILIFSLLMQIILKKNN